VSQVEKIAQIQAFITWNHEDLQPFLPSNCDADKKEKMGQRRPTYMQI
jgi:hypothetical protein